MPNVVIELPETTSQVATQWSQADYRLRVELHNSQVLIAGDANGLRNLAAQLLSLARDGTFSGCHLHLDGGEMLDDDSTSLIIQRD